MTTVNQNQSESTKTPGEKPVIYASTKDNKKDGIELWLNMPDERKKDENGETKPLSEGAPDLKGYLHIDNEKIGVSVWVKQKVVPATETTPEIVKPPFFSFSPNGKDTSGQYIKGNFGFGRAINEEKNAPLAEDRTAYIYAKLKVNNTEHELRGYVAKEGFGLMQDMGFSDEVIANAEKQNLVEKPKKAVQ
jgi:hypothetical protein